LHPAASLAELARIRQNRADRAPAVLLCTKEPLSKAEEKTVEEVTEKYGLEAGLFSIFKRGSGENKEGSVQKAAPIRRLLKNPLKQPLRANSGLVHTAEWVSLSMKKEDKVEDDRSLHMHHV
jgi:hypothetical protein